MRSEHSIDGFPGTIEFQFAGKAVSLSDIIDQVKKACLNKARNIDIYVKPNDNRVYYESEGFAGSLILLHLCRNVEEEEDTMNFGEKITLLRNLKGLSKRQVGDAIGTSDVSIHRYENGVRPKRPEVYEKLARLFGCTVKELTDDSVDLLPKDLQEKEVPEKKIPTEKPKKTEKANKADPVIEKAVEETTEKIAPEKAEKAEESVGEKLAPAEKNTKKAKAADEQVPTEEKDVPSIPVTEPFGKRLSTLRKAKNLTLAQTADKVGITQSAYKSMEYRNYRPRDIKVYNKLAKVLGCDVEYLKEGDKRFEKKAEKKVIIIPPKKAEKSEVPAKAPQPTDLGKIEENIPVEEPVVSTEKSSASSEVIKLESRLSVLLSGNGWKKEKKLTTLNPSSDRNTMFLKNTILKRISMGFLAYW